MDHSRRNRTPERPPGAGLRPRGRTGLARSHGARRALLAVALAVGACLAAPAGAAEAWPTKQITIVVPYPPGGLTDIVTRTIADTLTSQTGQTVTVLNKPGGGGQIGLREVLQAPRDGHTIALVVPATMVTLPLTNKNFTIKPMAEFEPVTIAVDTFMMLVANPKVARTLAEFRAYARANPNGLNYGTPGVGTSFHFFNVMLADALGISPTHVTYKGEAPALVDVTGGSLQYMLASNAARKLTDAGQLALLGVSSAKRVPTMPDVPTLREQGVDVVTDGWVGYAVAAGTPAAVADRVNAALVKALADPALRAKFAGMGYSVRGNSRAEFKADIAASTQRFGAMVTSGKVKIAN